MTSAGVDAGCAFTRVAVAVPATGGFTERCAATATDPAAPGREKLDPDRQADVLRELLPEGVTKVVVAVPYAVFGRGRQPIEPILAALTPAPVTLVPGPVAALAAVLRGRTDLGGTASVVVADLGAGHAELLLCDTSGELPAVRDHVTTGARTRKLDPFWRLAVAALPDAGREERLALAGALSVLPQGDLTKADLALNRCRTDTNYHATPVYDRQGRLRARVAMDVLEPIATRLGETAATLARSSPDAVGAPVLFLGGGSGIGPLRGSVLRGLGHAEGTGSVLDVPAEARAYAAARGAALIAAGEPGLAAVFEDALALELHWQHAGVLEDVLLPLADRLRAGEPELYAVDPRDGAPARIDVLTPQALRLWLRRKGAEAYVPLPYAGAPPLNPGRYQVGLRLDGPELPVLVFSPVDGGLAVSWPVTVPRGR
ncbi:hypothetical protein [Nonomuraea endophytica]|uniref:Hsp70 family protein n=1 Tax=Nonomuraea endophytica TaxID=714136 RepID=A0A7W8AEX6_9ACTN|nr:hypothetical protein [Nonomuraea endophytica]MBB5083826.1 hypothetical protein [Nonomuraea endophytica]